MTGITEIKRDWGDAVTIVRIKSTDTIATVSAANYILNQLANIELANSGPFQWDPCDFVLVCASDGWGLFTISANFHTLNAFAIAPATVIGAPVTVGDFAIFQSTSGNLEDLGYSPSDASKTKVVMANSATTVDNIAIFTDTAGTVGQNQPNALNNVSSASATPGAVRSIIGTMTLSNATYANGSNSVAGVRGLVNFVGSSSGFIYGTQGKIIPTGTLSGSAWNVGVFGQLDISAATINAGQIAPIWGDYGATSGTLTNQTGCYGIAMTNTTAVVTQGQLYLYGGSQNLMFLNTNAGLSGVTYFINAGVSAGSWGNATPPTPSKVLRISVDGTQYYLPLVNQNT